ncbi:MAG: hypothetical protein BWZ10_01160 [candidate division BRC1 bacterium ADurb.BinA364]|nr:MAG: hypothetical protein BWZ10_01160 [candidate division BRC1 bacterium ADurb.BinA364]
MNVLQNSLRVVGRLDSEQFLHFGVPQRGQLGDSDFLLHQRRLDFEAQNDMQRIRRLIGFDADERRPHDVDRAIEIVGSDPRQNLRKQLGQRPEPVAPERAAAPDLILPEPRLRFVQAERGGLGQRSVKVFGAPPLFIQAVAPFVNRGKEARSQVVRGDPRRQAHIGRMRAAGEGMRRFVLPPGFQVESHRLQNAHAEIPLLLRVVGLFQNRPRRRSRRSGHGLDHRRQFGPQPRENRPKRRRRHPAFVVLDQRIVRRIGVAVRLGLFAQQAHDLFQMRREGGEIGTLAGVRPGRRGDRRRLLQLAHQPLGQAARALEVVARFANDGALGIAELAQRFVRFEHVEQPSGFGVDQFRMGDRRKRGALPRAGANRLGRHIRFLVPVEQSDGAMNIGRLAESKRQVLKSVG